MKFVILPLLIFTLAVSYGQMPACVPLKGNVLYLGIDNPMTFAGITFSENENVVVSNGEIKFVTSSIMMVKPERVGDYTTTVGSGSRKYKFPFRVKYIPEPDVLLIGPPMASKMKSVDLKSTTGLRLLLRDFDWNLQYEVEKYQIARISSGTVESSENTGPTYTIKTRQVINKATIGDIYTFDMVYYGSLAGSTLLNRSVVIRVE